MSLRLQKVYPSTCLLWYQRQMNLELMFPSTICLRTANLEKWMELFTNLLALVLAYSVFTPITVTYIPPCISFVLREHFFAYISLLHHCAHTISLTSLQLHHHTFLSKLASITSLHLNCITWSKLISQFNYIIHCNYNITSLLHSINLTSNHTFTDSIRHSTFAFSTHFFILS